VPEPLDAAINESTDPDERLRRRSRRFGTPRLFVLLVLLVLVAGVGVVSPDRVGGAGAGDCGAAGIVVPDLILRIGGGGAMSGGGHGIRLVDDDDDDEVAVVVVVVVVAVPLPRPADERGTCCSMAIRDGGCMNGDGADVVVTDAGGRRGARSGTWNGEGVVVVVVALDENERVGAATRSSAVVEADLDITRAR
jgi:hypothetical protein